MDAADDLELRWLHLADPSQAGAGSLSGAPASGPGTASNPDRSNPGNAGNPGNPGRSNPGNPGNPGRSNPGDAGGERLTRHDLSNAVTAIAGAARLLCDRWDELGEAERKELASMVLRRADELRRALESSPSHAAGD